MTNKLRGHHDSRSLRPIGLIESIATFGFFSILLWLAIYVGIDWLHQTFDLPVMISWFIAGTFVALLPMILYVVIMVRREGADRLSDFATRLRLKRLDAADVKAVIGGLVAVVIASAAIIIIARIIDPNFLPKPPFMEVPSGNLIWVVVGWIPLFICNIVGEELLWRGYLLPRQQQSFGKLAWITNAILWLLYHWAIGLPTMIVILPTTLIIPWIVQRRQNTWVGILIHGIFNAMGFLLTIAGLAS